MRPDAVIDPMTSLRNSRQTRTRALVFPREHGAWGLLFIPLFTGAAVGLASAYHLRPLILFVGAALALFWLRTPVESLLGTSPLSAETPAERRTALIFSAGLAAISASCLIALFWNGRNRQLLILGGVVACVFVIQTLLMKLGRKARMPAQMLGAAGLTCAAPAAYCVVTGNLDTRALALWAANWVFAGNQIHFVQLRIHAARALTFAEKYARGQIFFLAQIAFLPILAFAAYTHRISPLVIVAFLPALGRGFYWFFSQNQPLRVKSLGWSEMRQGILFGFLLATAFILSSR